MTESNKWKSKLLSSSVPMEYEVAQLLVSNGFSVDSEFSYSRNDAGVLKDFSIDLLATQYITSDIDNILAVTELLVECKYRHYNNIWLFFEDTNEGEMSPFTLGHTIRAIDDFSWKFFPANCTTSFDEAATFCMKGIEIDTSNGNVYDSEIKHGLMQLQYGLPRLITDRVGFEIKHPENENNPFFFCPILLTTSRILVANPGTSIRMVEKADSLDDFSKPKPWVVVHSDLTPDFERHRQMECKSLSMLVHDEWVKVLDAERAAKGEYEFLLPSKRCAALSDPPGRKLFEFFSQTIICSLEHFPTLLKEIQKVTKLGANSYVSQKNIRVL